MKNTVRISLAFLIVVGLVLMNAPRQAQAYKIEVNPNIAEGSWTGGTSQDVSALESKAPSWIQLLTAGVKVSETGKICHPFRGGQFGWVGEIREYKDGQWVKLPTVNDWVPNKEGQFMSCAQATEAGTYALFGYYKALKLTAVPSFDCNTIEWSSLSSNIDTNLFFEGYVSNVPAGTTISVRVTASNNSELVGQTGTVDTTDNSGYFFGDSGLSGFGLSSYSVILTESTHNCSSEVLNFIS